MTLEAPRPLDGWRIAVTRAPDGGDSLTEALVARGARPVICALTHIAWHGLDALAAALHTLGDRDWLVCTSAHGVRAIAAVPGAIAMLRAAGVPVAAVGPTTAQAFIEAGLPVSLVPVQHDADGLVAAWRAMPPAADGRVLFPCADDARPTLVDGLRALGVRVEAHPCYASVADPAGAAQLAAAIAAGAIDLLTFAAPSAVTLAAAALPTGRPPAAVIGRVTAAAARDAGFDVVAVADVATMPALVEAIVRAVQAGHLVRVPPLSPTR